MNCIGQSKTDTLEKFVNKDNVETIEDSASHYVKYWQIQDTVYEQIYNLEGVLYVEAKKVNGVYEGTSKRYYDFGQLEFVGQYSEGLKTGIWHQYHINGTLSAIGKFDRDKMIGVWKYYHDNGTLALKEKRNRKGNKNGLQRSFYSNGNRFDIGRWNGKVEGRRKMGKWKWYYINGQLKEVGTYKNGYRVGKWKYYHDDGSLMAQFTFEKNQTKINQLVQNSPPALYFVEDILDTVPSHKLRLEWEGGFLQGEQLTYHKNGNLASKSLYKDGKLIDISFWDEQGEEIKITVEDYFPTYPKFDSNIDDFFNDNIEYPINDDIDINEESKVFVGFYITQDGSIQEITVYESPSDFYTNETLRIIKLMKGMWKPGMVRNVPVEKKINFWITYY